MPAVRGALEGRFLDADPGDSVSSWVIPRLYGRAEAAMVAVQYDAFGAGRADEIHAELFAALLADLALTRRTAGTSTPPLPKRSPPSI